MCSHILSSLACPACPLVSLQHLWRPGVNPHRLGCNWLTGSSLDGHYTPIVDFFPTCRAGGRQARNRNSPFLSVIPGLFRAPQKDMLLDFFSKAMIPVPQFSSVQFSPSVVWLFATPRTAARQASLSFTISQSVLKLMSFESVMLTCRIFFSYSVKKPFFTEITYV